MVSTRNTSRSNANLPRMQDPPGDMDSKPHGTAKAVQANTNEVEALRLVNQRLIEELEQLTRQMQHPRETRQTQEGHNIPPHEGQHGHDIPRGAEAEAESSRARGHEPQLAPAEEGNGAMLGGHVGNEETHHPQPGAEEQSWEQRFRSLQQELGRVKEVVKGRAPDTMDTLVQQTESPFTADVLRYGHRTDNCIQLKREIEYLIQRGYLRRFISPGNQAQNKNQALAQQSPPRQTTTQHQKPLGEIHVISGGFAEGGESSSARKAHLRSIRSVEMGKIQAVSKLPQLDTTITFSDSDIEGCQHPQDDPLVVRAIVANTTVHRVLIDNWSSADIIFTSAFDKMGIGREKLEPVNTHLRGFSGEKVVPLGSIQLVLTLGEPPC